MRSAVSFNYVSKHSSTEQPTQQPFRKNAYKGANASFSQNSSSQSDWHQRGGLQHTPTAFGQGNHQVCLRQPTDQNGIVVYHRPTTISTNTNESTKQIESTRQPKRRSTYLQHRKSQESSCLSFGDTKSVLNPQASTLQYFSDSKNLVEQHYSPHLVSEPQIQAAVPIQKTPSVLSPSRVLSPTVKTAVKEEGPGRAAPSSSAADEKISHQTLDTILSYYMTTLDEHERPPLRYFNPFKPMYEQKKATVPALVDCEPSNVMMFGTGASRDVSSDRLATLPQTNQTMSRQFNAADPSMRIPRLNLTGRVDHQDQKFGQTAAYMTNNATISVSVCSRTTGDKLQSFKDEIQAKPNAQKNKSIKEKVKSCLGRKNKRNKEISENDISQTTEKIEELERSLARDIGKAGGASLKAAVRRSSKVNGAKQGSKSARKNYSEGQAKGQGNRTRSQSQGKLAMGGTIGGGDRSSRGAAKPRPLNRWKRSNSVEQSQMNQRSRKVKSPSPETQARKEDLPLMEPELQRKQSVKVSTQKGEVKVSVADLVALCSRHATLQWCPRFEVALFEHQRGKARSQSKRKQADKENNAAQQTPKN